VSSVHHLRITLKHTKPSIWRELLMPSDLRLDRLHDVLQIVMGWEDCHMHQFIVGGLRDGLHIGIPDDFGMPGPQTRDEKRYTLEQIAPAKGAKFLYWYDFGDDWFHDITVKAVGEYKPGTPGVLCLKGAGACPPEDCGGPWGHAHLIEVLADPAHEEYEELREWVGVRWDPAHYDMVAANNALAKLAPSWRKPVPKARTKGR
jgi:hypothetical protein